MKLINLSATVPFPVFLLPLTEQEFGIHPSTCPSVFKHPQLSHLLTSQGSPGFVLTCFCSRSKFLDRVGCMFIVSLSFLLTHLLFNPFHFGFWPSSLLKLVKFTNIPISKSNGHVEFLFYHLEHLTLLSTPSSSIKLSNKYTMHMHEAFAELRKN